jgi:gliding motility-associated-like protein
MKLLYTLLFFTGMASFSLSLYGQGANCASANPFCTDNTYTFPASVNTTAESSPDYGCLGSQPNPAWYYLQIGTSGNIVIDLGSTNLTDDIDFICWGPFNNLSSACSNLTGGGIFDLCSLTGTYPCGNIVDCSYSTSATEVCTIPNAVAGQYYMFLITNYANVATDIFANTDVVQSTGSTNCSIVPPPPAGSCIINYFSANISACQGNNTFTVDGDIEFTDNPGSGTLVVQIDNGTTVFTQTINPPFVDGQTYTYSIPNIPADGAASTISVYFTADPGCSQQMNYTAAADCSCFSDIGTQTVTATGQSNTDFVLCYGDVIDLNFNGDNVDPDFEPLSTATYDPAVAWMIYTCPPSVGLVATAGIDIFADDPCNLGVLPSGNFQDINDMFIINAFPPGTFTDNIVYYVPLTLYSDVDNIYANFFVGMPPCYDMGAPIAVQYLPEITSTEVQDCAAGTVTVTVNGGAPELLGSAFTVVAGSLSPATATFTNTTCNNGGTIVLGNLSVGDVYSFDIADQYDCPITISGTMQGSGGATLTYPQAAYCQNLANPSPTVTGTTGGTFTAPAGLSINSSTGVVNLAASTPGTYLITYAGPGAFCPPTATFTLTVNAMPVVVAGTDQIICSGTAVTLTGTGAANYLWDNSVVNGVPFYPTSTNMYTVTGTSAAGCSATDQVLVTVESAPVPSFSGNNLNGCAPLTVTFTNNGAGSNCQWNFGDGTTATGCGSVTHTYNNPGCYNVTLASSSPSGCPGSTTLTNYICVAPDPVASFTPLPAIMTQLNSTSQMVNSSTNAVTYEWNFGDGQNSSLVSPVHTFPSEEAGAYSVQLIATSLAGCKDTAYALVVIEEELIFYVPNTFTPDNDEFNQFFQPVFTSGFDPFDFNMTIFNRWGEIIFETNNAAIGWDGTYHDQFVQDGTYTWKIEFKTKKNDARKYAVGHVNVLR